MCMTWKSNITIQVYSNDDSMSKLSGKKNNSNASSKVNQVVPKDILLTSCTVFPRSFCRLKSLLRRDSSSKWRNKLHLETIFAFKLIKKNKMFNIKIENYNLMSFSFKQFLKWFWLTPIQILLLAEMQVMIPDKLHRVIRIINNLFGFIRSGDSKNQRIKEPRQKLLLADTNSIYIFCMIFNWLKVFGTKAKNQKTR